MRVMLLTASDIVREMDLEQIRRSGKKIQMDGFSLSVSEMCHMSYTAIQTIMFKYI